MKFGYLGNFEPEHSTESHVSRAIENNGDQVVRFQEHKVEEWDAAVARLSRSTDLETMLWTRTIWNPPISYDRMRQMQEAARSAGVTTVSYHLDRWWGLNREQEVRESPFFRNDIVITADGGHDAEFARNGTNHVWFPPGVSRDECLREPVIRPEYQHDVVFCGSSHGYHNEWNYRLQLVSWLESTFGARLGVYPKDQPALRGQPLVDLYASAKVMVGDSCLNGGITNYWSDRIPETLGRGGFLIHPEVEGLDRFFTPGEHLVTYRLGDFDDLREKIEHYVVHDDERWEIAQAGRDHVLKNHTYEVRMERVKELVGDFIGG